MVVVFGCYCISIVQACRRHYKFATTFQALNSKVVERLKETMHQIRSCHSQHSIEDLLQRMQLQRPKNMCQIRGCHSPHTFSDAIQRMQAQTYGDGDVNAALAKDQKHEAFCDCLRTANMQNIRGNGEVS